MVIFDMEHKYINTQPMCLTGTLVRVFIETFLSDPSIIDVFSGPFVMIEWRFAVFRKPAWTVGHTVPLRDIVEITK